MKIETFFKRFNNRVINNHLARNAPFSGHMFETYGKELKFVKSQPEECVFTLIEESGKEAIIEGYHWVNRLGYFVVTPTEPKKAKALSKPSIKPTAKLALD